MNEMLQTERHIILCTNKKKCYQINYDYDINFKHIPISDKINVKKDVSQRP